MGQSCCSLRICCGLSYGADDPNLYKITDDKDAMNYVTKYKLDRTKVIAATGVDEDNDMYEFMQKYIDRSDLQGIVVNGSKVMKNARAANEELGVKGIQMMGRIVEGNTTLRIIHLNGQRLDEQTLRPLVEALVSHESLEVLDLYDCKITNDGAAFVFNNLKDNSKLKYINLGANDINTERQIEMREVTDQEKYSHISLAF